MSVRRLKTYAGETGSVYQYYFVGKRPSLPQAPEGTGTEYVFDVNSDVNVTFAVSVFLLSGALETWARVHGRELTEPEQYAAAKLRLLRAFDETENMLQEGRRLVIDATLLDEIIAGLGVES